MSKQDRQGVRTPADIERKYDLGQLKNIGQGGTSSEEVNQINQTLSQYMASTNGQIKTLQEKDTELQGEIDTLTEQGGTLQEQSAALQEQVYSQQQQIGALKDTDTDLQYLVGVLQEQVSDLQGATPTFALVDRETGTTYNLYMSNGVLMLEGGDL